MVKFSRGHLIGCQILRPVLAGSSLSLELTDAPPPGASSYINPSFAGFGIEPHTLFSFTGGAVPNTLTFNLINNLVNYTGRPPHIRIGGDAQDSFIYQESQNEWAVIPNPSPKGAGVDIPSDGTIIGPRYFEAANRFPQGTPITWGLNMAYALPDYKDRITTMAFQILSRCSNLNIYSFEMGNEPDLYLQHGFRTEWSGNLYTQEWLDRVAVVYDKVLKPNGLPSNFFETACTAATIGQIRDFEINNLVNYGINVQATNSPNPFVSSWNQHDYYYYIDVSTYPLTLDYFMTWQTTEDQFVSWAAQVQQAKSTPWRFHLREMGSVGPGGYAGITDVFGAALWTLNFLLYAASLDIASVQFHQTDASNSSAWQPIPLFGRLPFVRPSYYGYAAFDQLIGPSCKAQVSQYKITGYPAGYDGAIRAYSVYQAGVLASVVVINGKVTNSKQANKPNVTVQAKLPASHAGQTVHLSYLTGPGAEATEGTTWNGISFEKGEGTPCQVTNDDLTAQVAADGSAFFTVRDSEAVVATVGRKTGTGLQADAAACNAFNRGSQARGISAIATMSSAPNSSATGSKAPNHVGSKSAAAVSRAPLTSFISFGIVGLASAAVVLV